MTSARTPGQHGQIANRILRSLPKAEYEEFLPHLELMRFPMGGSCTKRARK